MKPKYPVDHFDTPTLSFCSFIMKNDPTSNKKNFSWEDFDSLGMRLDSNIGSGEKAIQSVNSGQELPADSNSIDQKVDDPYLELPDQTYRQIKDLNDALKIQAHQITQREEKLSKLIVDFEREKREFELKKLGSNDQIERRLDLLIAQSKRKTNRAFEATTSQGSDTISEQVKNTFVSGHESPSDFESADFNANRTVTNDTTISDNATNPPPVFLENEDCGARRFPCLGIFKTD